MMSLGEEPAGNPAGLRILVVEDEDLIAMLMEEMLVELGHTVLGPIARLGPAVEMATAEDFDVAILDVNINGGHTYPVAEALAARGIPFVFSTGYSRDKFGDRFADTPILQKPFRQDDLEKAIANLYKAKKA